MSSTSPALPRRHMLVGCGLLALLGVATPGCRSVPAPPHVDELESQRQLARSDSDLATAAAAAASPTMVPALTEVAEERAEHARALSAEIARVTGETDSGEPDSASNEASGTTTATEPSEPAPTVYEVASALRAAADSAGRLATETSGYRAGLLASIAAACTAAHDVALVMAP